MDRRLLIATQRPEKKVRERATGQQSSGGGPPPCYDDARRCKCKKMPIWNFQRHWHLAHIPRRHGSRNYRGGVIRSAFPKALEPANVERSNASF